LDYFAQSFTAAFELIFRFDPDVWLTVWTSLRISVIAALVAALLAIPAGIIIATNDFPGKCFLQQILNTLMAMPTVVVGLLLYGLFTRQGPMGDWGLLYSPAAVVIGECVLILPIILNLTIVAVQSADKRLVPTLQSLGSNQFQTARYVLSETRLAVVAAVVTGFGRAIGEVGAAMMLGGNIEGFTRTMTTAIALETSKGEFELGLALGMLLLTIAFVVNFGLQVLQTRGQTRGQQKSHSKGSSL
jgi:tungstate transport system permease protein